MDMLLTVVLHCKCDFNANLFLVDLYYMNFRFGGSFFKQTARQFFAKPAMSPPLKGKGFATAALRMQDM
jgi:hypothetical protein